MDKSTQKSRWWYWVLSPTVFIFFLFCLQMTVWFESERLFYVLGIGLLILTLPIFLLSVIGFYMDYQFVTMHDTAWAPTWWLYLVPVVASTILIFSIFDIGISVGIAGVMFVFLFSMIPAGLVYVYNRHRYVGVP